jgi:predicted negative regulator of RcsB-dependent stress response
MSTEPTTCRACGQPLDESGRCRRCHPEEAGHVWTIRDWRPLLVLWLVIALGFSFTRLAVNAYNDKRETLAERNYAAGMRAMEAQQPAKAVDAFEAALIYSHDNFQYQLKLTDALLASGATGEAVAQLHAFLDQRPNDAQVNLKLARLEARRHHVEEALRYYLAAIEGDWPENSDAFAQRIAVRFESAEYLVEQGRLQEADNALQALAAVLPVSWPEQGKLGDLFLRVGDAGRALTVYQAELNQDPENQAALLGAAKASLSVASYTAARHYLVELKPPTEESRALLAQMDRMEALDPFARNVTETVRVARTLAAFRIASTRMAACRVPASGAAGMSPSGEAPADGQRAEAQQHWGELARWADQLAPMMDQRKLRGRDDVIESAMRFAFQVELAAEKQCGVEGNATVDDEALLLLARERLGAGQ